ncbi:MAG: phosphate ABC transporter permease subunit PstC [Thermoplasmata archaeon]|nr:phosphate ABC transporter permease subunit PstC [Thermoplasmata archaeon]
MTATAPEPELSVPPFRSKPRFEQRLRLLRALGTGFHAASLTAAAGVVAVLGAIALLLAVRSQEAFSRFGPRFLSGTLWDPVHGVYGALPAIVGTALTSLLALALAVPVALGVAIFLSEFAPRWLREPVAIAVDLSAAIPSVVLGFWAFLVVGPIMGHTVEPTLAAFTGGTGPFAGTPTGYDVLTASVVLAIMIVPTIAAISRASLSAVPRVQREAALTLGATGWEATRTAVLGPARLGIAGAVLLGLGRAAGETMVVAMTIGNIYQVPTSLFSPGQSIASEIIGHLESALPGEQSGLFALGLLLLAITILINVGARALIWNFSSTTPARRGPVGRRTAALRALEERSTGSPPAAASAGAGGTGELGVSTVRRGAARPGAARRWKHRTMVAVAGLATILALVPLVAIVGTAFVQGGGAVIHPGFYTRELPAACNPTGGSRCPLGGIGPAIQGTILLLAIAAAVAIPVGLLAGIYLAEYGRNRLGRVLSFFTEVMAGIPSVLIGVFVFLLLIATDPTVTYSALSGGFALSILVIPIVTRVTEDALRAVPVHEREAAAALGYPKHRITLRVVVRSARTGIVVGILLALARAGGETAALVYTAFGSPFFLQGLDQPVASLPVLIYKYGFVSQYANWSADAWGATLILLVILLLLSLATRLAARAPSTDQGNA